MIPRSSTSSNGNDAVESVTRAMERDMREGYRPVGLLRAAVLPLVARRQRQFTLKDSDSFRVGRRPSEQVALSEATVQITQEVALRRQLDAFRYDVEVQRVRKAQNPFHDRTVVVRSSDVLDEGHVESHDPGCDLRDAFHDAPVSPDWPVRRSPPLQRRGV